ncbi:glycosyltransferase [Sphingomonas sp. Leaf10]|uniref:glycosyltransferase n=1 Tax=Sphingomonas sp. Leaf10 TaxID=1735676 RepID=UPI00070205FE|nr:glycosyltransferase [Sphingomonas sp. Leaf10]KQM35875.1 hypothetical protein ASE59_17775 [Sphingomonas sp. Leaf10]
MRIVDVNGFYAPEGGGVRAYVDLKLAYAARHGHEVIVLAPGPEDRFERRPGGGIQWVAAPAFPLDRRYGMFVDAAPIHRLLDQWLPDAVEASSPWRTADIVAAWPGDAPRHWIMHADPLAAYAYRWFGRVATIDRIDRWFGWYWQRLQRIAPAYRSIVCANDWLTDRLVAGGLGNARTVRFGIEAGIFSPARRNPDLREKLLAACGRPADGMLLLGVGRHSPEKNWPLVIAAMNALPERCQAGLLLVGEGRDSAALRRQIGGNPHIQLLSPTHDRAQLAELMASADALVHGCEAETFCFVAAEGAASGLPVIAPTRGAAADSAGVVAVRYAAGDPVALRTAIETTADRRGVKSLAGAAAPRHRTMDQHFAALFSSYAAPWELAA